MTDAAALRSRIPWVPWDEPVRVEVVGHTGRWVCRYCIALHGLAATDLAVTPFAFDTRLEAREHIGQVHE